MFVYGSKQHAGMNAFKHAVENVYVDNEICFKSGDLKVYYQSILKNAKTHEVDRTELRLWVENVVENKRVHGADAREWAKVVHDTVMLLDGNDIVQGRCDLDAIVQFVIQ